MITPSESPPTNTLSPGPSKKSQALSFFFGGVLPIVAFTIIEDNYGPLWGTVAGMIFGVGELFYEKVKFKKIATITWVGNGMILGLGGISIFTNDGIWFKLQPAILEAFFALLLWGSLIAKKNLLLMMAEKQGQQIPDILKVRFNGLTFRIGIFMATHSVLAVWAAFYWSTSAWAWLKGAGLTISFIAYMIIELIFIRKKIQRK